MIDTGADKNVIKLNALHEDVTVDVRDSVEMRGITDERMETLGTTIVAILDQPVLFHVVRPNFPIHSDGILGKAYLRQEKAEISFAHNTIVTQSQPIRPIHFIGETPPEEAPQKNSTPRVYRISSRTR